MKKDKNKSSDDWKVAATVPNNIEFEMISGILEMAGIPSTKKTYGLDEFAVIMLGVPLGGIDVMVPGDRLEEAKAILDVSEEDLEKQIEKEVEESIKEQEKQDKKETKKK